MRKLMWFTLGFGAVCALCSYLWLTEGLLLPGIILAGVSCLLLVGSRWVKWFRIPATIALGCALALGWFQLYATQYLRPAAALDGQITEVTARCTDYSYRTNYGTAVEGFLHLDGMPYRAKFYVSGEIDMEPGDALTGVFRFRVTTPDSADDPTNHGSEGIFLLAYQQEDAQLGKVSETPIWGYPAILREKLTEIIENNFAEDAAGFARALLLGDRSGIDYETSTAFKVSGISHIIAVSGLHVSILFSLVYVLCFKKRWLVALIGIPVMVLFAAVAGFSPSVTRATIMITLMMLAMCVGRDYDGPTELAFACLVMMVVNPLVTMSISFQLSAGCVAGIFLFQQKIKGWLLDKLGKGKLKGWFAGSVSMTISAMTLTTPLVAYYFGAVSLVGILTNLLTLWIISLIFYGIMLVCLMGSFWSAGAAVIARVIGWAIRYVLVTAKVLASFPLAAVYTRSAYIVGWLVFVYLLLAAFLTLQKKHPGVLFCCGAIGLCLALGASWLEPLTDDCRMTVLNVGQGQSIILQSEGKTYLVDCGGDSGSEAADLAAETLMSMGVFRLDGLIVTHYDADHAGGVQNLLTRIPADMIFLPDAEDETGLSLQLEAAHRVNMVSENLLLTYDKTKLSIFGPVVPDSDNESSLAVLFQAGNCDILITGDRGDLGEWMLLKTAALPEVDVLVVGHHGSKYSTSEELLTAVKPKLAVISVGENRYGHPTQEVLDRLAAVGCPVYRTDQLGNITFRR